MRRKKTFISLALAAVMLISGCNSEKYSFEPLTTSSALPEITVEQSDVAESSALDFVADMKLGWNLGNTFDATGSVSDELELEKAWSGVYTTEEMICAIKAAGFNSIRIPVSWHNHVDDDFNINEAWLNRVKEVVDYAYDNGMYVILNIHHDNETDFLYPDYEHLEQSKEYVSKIWTQLSATFKDYSEKLVFESMNEPRLKGTNLEWWIDSSSEDGAEAIDCINQLNQLFVDIVRASGGNNTTRYLLVPGYCASIDFSTADNFIIPTDLDTNDNKILISVHGYTPYGFSLQSPTEAGSIDTFDASSVRSTRDIDTLMQTIYDNFTSKGIGVVIGEFGSRAKSGNVDARTQHAAYYVAAARAVGVSCFWWDNNAFLGSGELFGLYNRKTLEWEYPDIVMALVENS